MYSFIGGVVLLVLGYVFYSKVPGIFMLYMVSLYLLTEQIGFGLEMNISYWISAGLTLAILVAFAYRMKRMKKAVNPNDDLINDQNQLTRYIQT